MNTEHKTPRPEQIVELTPQRDGHPVEPESRKKLFIEPEISVPVNVLEATTFFQAATSGVTN